MKLCKLCLVQKERDQFAKHKAHKDKLDNRCRDCIRENAKLIRRLKRSAPPKPRVCEICHTDHYRLCVDHDPETKTFRGWICDQCNLAIGKLKHDINIMANAINYLTTHKQRMDKAIVRYIQRHSSIDSANQRAVPRRSNLLQYLSD